MPHDPSPPPRTRGPLAWSLTISAVAGLGALGVAHHLARTLAPSARTAVPDPEVTGSISPPPGSVVSGPASAGPGVRVIVLDPGRGRERLLVRGP